jgi:predicted RNA-binding protein with RPS1 domain
MSGFVDEKIAVRCTYQNENNACSERSVKYIAKWSAKSLDQRKVETKRLEGLLFQEMKSDLKKWVRERVGILKTSLDEKEL